MVILSKKLLSGFLTLFIFAFLLTVKALAVETNLLTSSWNLVGNNGAAEKYQAISANALNNATYIKVTYNLHGACLLGGDASAIIFDQNNSWHYISLSNYGKNCLDGSQSVNIPLSAFSGLNLTQPVGTLHARFWLNKPFNIDITEVIAAGSSATPAPIPATSPSPVPQPSSTPTPVQTPSPISTDSYNGQYFNNMTLSGTPKVIKNDTSINFNWAAGSPDIRIPADLFSVRWSKGANLSAGIYRFTVRADDGVRVFVDGVKIIDGWKDQAVTTYNADLALTAGNHNLVIEYYEKYGLATAQFSYMPINSTPLPTPRPVQTPAPISTPAPAPTGGSSWSIQSVSSMKETKDKICGQDSQAFIQQWVAKAKSLGVNYVAVETPYDNPSCGDTTAYAKNWILAIRSAGLKVWHRHMPLAFEGIYSVAKTRQDFLPMISNYIKANPSLFQSGDIFSPIPEPQNGGISGITYCANSVCQFDNAASFNAWLRNAIDVSNTAFASIGLGNQMKVGYYGFDGFVAWGANNPDWHGILEDATVAKMGNITIDHYPELIGTTMSKDLDDLQRRYPNVPIVIGEWGSTGATGWEQQVINSMGAAKRPGVIGFNYWHMGMGGNEALINSDFSNRIQYDEVQSFFTGLR